MKYGFLCEREKIAELCRGREREDEELVSVSVGARVDACIPACARNIIQILCDPVLQYERAAPNAFVFP